MLNSERKRLKNQLLFFVFVIMVVMLEIDNPILLLKYLELFEGIKNCFDL